MFCISYCITSGRRKCLIVPCLLILRLTSWCEWCPLHYKVLISISPIGFRTNGCLDPLFYYSLEMVIYYTAWYSLYLTLEFLCKELFLINYLIIFKYSLSIKMFLFSFTYSFEKKMSWYYRKLQKWKYKFMFLFCYSGYFIYLSCFG